MNSTVWQGKNRRRVDIIMGESMRTKRNFPKGSAPVAVIMITLNESHNMTDVLDNLSGWAQEVFLVTVIAITL